MAIREGKWRCRSCSRVNRGRDVSCVGCGEPRGEVEFFLDDDAPEVTDGALLERASAGPDWICAYCSSSNVANAKSCSGCGGPRDSGHGRSEGPVVSSAHEQPRHHAAAAPVARAPGGDASWLPKLFAALFAAPACAAFAIVGLLFLCALTTVFRSPVRRASPLPEVSTTEPWSPPPRASPPPPPRHVAALVSRVAWERTIHTERRRELEESGRSVPENARVLSEESVVDRYENVRTGTRTITKTKTVQTGTKTVTKSKRVQTGTRRVKVGTRSKGNGFFEDVYRSEPVYGTRTYTESVPVYGPKSYTEEEPVYERRPVHATVYHYVVQRWTPAGDVVARGADLSPVWPAVTFDDVTRESGRGEWLGVTFVDESGGSIRWESSTCADIARFVPGSRWDLLVDHRGQIVSIDAAAVAPVTSEDGTAAQATH